MKWLDEQTIHVPGFVTFRSSHMWNAYTLYGKRFAVLVAPSKREARTILSRWQRWFTILRPYRSFIDDFKN